MRTLFVMGLLGAALAAPLPGQDYSRIDRWAGEYCGAAKDFMDSLIELEKQQKQWELSYALIQHFQNTISAAERSAQRLERIELPRGPEGVWEKLRSNLPAWADYYAEVNRVREVHQATIRAMSGIREAAQESIRDINYASNRGLFQNALQKYQESARKQAEKLESATKELSPKSRASLGRCTLNLIPGPQR